MATAPSALASKTVSAVIETGGVAGGLAANPTSGDVYVQILSGDRVQRFSAGGAQLGEFGSSGSADGQFSFGSAVVQAAVEPSGSVWVADPGNDRVQRFSAAGSFETALSGAGSGDGQFAGPRGVAVDPASGDVYVADTENNRVQRFSSAGAFEAVLGAGELTSPSQVAVDPSGSVYVLDAGAGRIVRYFAAGTFDTVIGEGQIQLPFTMAVSPTNGHVFATAFDSDFTLAISELDGTGTVVDVHGQPPVQEVAGLAVAGGGEPLYASDGQRARVLALTDAGSPPASATIEPVTDVAVNSATLHGSVNPNGSVPTRWYFEYGLDGATWTATPGGLLPAGTSDVAVSEPVAGLLANSEYRVRLVATKADYGGPSATSAEATFSTLAAAPVVRALAAGPRSDVAAWLGAQVNPQNAATTYYVEYAAVADTGYADSERFPVGAEADVGAGSELMVVRQLVQGLQPSKEYRFRIVATNATGTTVGASRTFRTRDAAPKPPAGRGYEMVSPLDKNGGDIDRNLPGAMDSTSGAAESGDAVAYAAQAQFAGLGSGAVQGQYRSVRESDGWSTKGINPPVQAEPAQGINSATIQYLSPDLSSSVVGSNRSLAAGGEDLGGSWGLYLQDSAGTYRLLSDPVSPLVPEVPGATPARVRARLTFGGASADMSHVVMDSDGRQLTPDGPASDLEYGVYEWFDGQVRFVSVLPSGDPATSGHAGAGSGSGQQFYPGDHLVSDDGQRIFFSDGPSSASSALYVREGGTATRAVSPSELDGADPSVALPGKFQAAKASDGSLALFTSNQRLTSDAAAADGQCSNAPVESCHDDLYQWDASGEGGERLTDLTTADARGGGVLGIAAAADDLSHVYFVANGVLADGAVSGRPNLYAWTGASGVRHVATLDGEPIGGDAGDAPVWGIERWPHGRRYRDARVSADGNRLLFASRARITAHDTAGRRQVYLYDFAADRLTCVSCEGGSPSQGDSWLFYPTVLPEPMSNETPAAPYRLPRNLSDDGQRAFFETDQSLVAGDVNGLADVYMWSEGELTLISTGKGGGRSEFVDASTSGDDVFFTTRQRLVGADADNQVDIYDARVDGGFPPQVLPPICVGDPCQGPPGLPPVVAEPASGAGVGDPPPVKRASFSVRGLSKAQRRTLAAGRTTTLTVRVDKTGRIAVRGTAKVGKRSRTVVSAAKVARHAGSVKVPLRLSKEGRRALEASGRMRVSLTVRFAGAKEPRKLSLTLASASKGGGGR